MGVSGLVGLVADDDAYFRIAVSTILTRQFGFSNVVEASTFDEAIRVLSGDETVSFALFGLSLLGITPAANLKTVRDHFPDVRVGVISASISRRDILLALESGVHGYMPKQLSVAELSIAFQSILTGGIYVPACLAAVSENAHEPIGRPIEVHVPKHATGGSMLTSRQQDVLDLLVLGKSNKEIALTLKIGEGTVKIHMAAIFKHFGVKCRAAAAVAGTKSVLNVKGRGTAAITGPMLISNLQRGSVSIQ